MFLDSKIKVHVAGACLHAFDCGRAKPRTLRIAAEEAAQVLALGGGFSKAGQVFVTATSV